MIGLEKYRGTRTRHTCPACGAKHCFVRYLTGDGNYLADDVGKCNRESSCGYHKKPRDFFAEQPQTPNKSRDYSRPDSKGKTLQNLASEKTYQNLSFSKSPDGNTPPPVSTIDSKYLIQSLERNTENYFIYFLETLFDEATVKALVDRFAIGTAKDGKTVFWQIDQRGFVRTGRVMLYDRHTGKRSKEVHQNWIHSILQKNGSLPNFELRQCLFGLHQLLSREDEEKIIGIVESDKTAVLASAVMPDLLWMSAGAKGYLNERLLAPLARRQVVLFPDADAYVAWKEKALSLRSVCPALRVSNFLDRILTDEQRAAGYDIADFLTKQQIEKAAADFAADDFARNYNRKVGEILADDSAAADVIAVMTERAAILQNNFHLSEDEADRLAIEQSREFVFSYPLLNQK